MQDIIDFITARVDAQRSGSGTKATGHSSR